MTSVSIRLETNTVDTLIEQTCNHPSLIFLVAMPDDAAAKRLIEAVIPCRGVSVPVPRVLIEGQSVAVIVKHRLCPEPY
jgi:hypothetical protein